MGSTQHSDAFGATEDSTYGTIWIDRKFFFLQDNYIGKIERLAKTKTTRRSLTAVVQEKTKKGRWLFPPPLFRAYTLMLIDAYFSEL